MSLKAAGRLVLAFISRLTKMEAGFAKDFTPKQSLNVGGVSMTQAQIIARLSTAVGLFAAVDSARSAYIVALAAKNAGVKVDRIFMTNLEEALRQQYGKDSAVLPDFGVSLPKPRKVRTPQDKVVSLAHGKATRELHGIKGAKQRAAITVEGKPGLVLVDAKGQPVAGALTGPTPPGSGTPVEASTTAAASPAAETTAPSGGTPTVK